MGFEQDKQKVKDYYNQEVNTWKDIYKEESEEYPANTIRLNFIVERLKQNKVKSVFDVGCGACGPIIRLLNEGFTVKGFDFSEEMIKEGKKELEKAGFDPNLVNKGDLEDKSTFPNEKFDAIIALGVLPHVENVDRALNNIKNILNDNGVVFISFRNDLFAAYTMNKYSLDFFINRVINLGELPDDVSDDIVSYYSDRLKTDKPVKRKNGKIDFTDIYAKFHNPLNIDTELFEPNGFNVANIHFYHYHALPPIFEDKYPELFRKESLKIEKPNDWRGYLLASAFVVEAKKQ